MRASDFTRDFTPGTRRGIARDHPGDEDPVAPLHGGRTGIAVTEVPGIRDFKFRHGLVLVIQIIRK